MNDDLKEKLGRHLMLLEEEVTNSGQQIEKLIIDTPVEMEDVISASDEEQESAWSMASELDLFYRDLLARIRQFQIDHNLIE